MYKPEMNFLTQLELSHNGMILEIKDEFNLMRWSMSQLSELEDENKGMIDKIIVVSLRKLLFENQHSPILLEVCPEFKMPPLKGRVIDGIDKLKITIPPFTFVDEHKWLALKDWQEQRLAYYNKTVDDLPNEIPNDTFQVILNKLKGDEKTEVSNMFTRQTIQYKGENMDVYIRNNTDDDTIKEKTYQLLTKVGYYHLSIYDFIKHIADKRGTHIDFAMAPLIKIMNDNVKGGHGTAIQCFAIQLIYAAKKQIPEFADYWPEMDDFIVLLSEP